MQISFTNISNINVPEHCVGRANPQNPRATRTRGARGPPADKVVRVHREWAQFSNCRLRAAGVGAKNIIAGFAGVMIFFAGKMYFRNPQVYFHTSLQFHHVFFTY